MKTCKKCGATKPTTEFYRRGKWTRGECRRCTIAATHSNYVAHLNDTPSVIAERKLHAAARGREWARKNPAKVLAKNNAAWSRAARAAYAKKRIAEGMAIITAARASGCVDCGNTNPLVLQSDHVKDKKIKGVTRLVMAARWRLIAELAKCETRCANCHQIVTHLRRRAAKGA